VVRGGGWERWLWREALRLKELAALAFGAAIARLHDVAGGHVFWSSIEFFVAGIGEQAHQMVGEVRRADETLIAQVVGGLQPFLPFEQDLDRLQAFTQPGSLCIDEFDHILAVLQNDAHGVSMAREKSGFHRSSIRILNNHCVPFYYLYGAANRLEISRLFY
jgi:hypothetical protein